MCAGTNVSGSSTKSNPVILSDAKNPHKPPRTPTAKGLSNNNSLLNSYRHGRLNPPQIAAIAYGMLSWPSPTFPHPTAKLTIRSNTFVLIRDPHPERKSPPRRP